MRASTLIGAALLVNVAYLMFFHVSEPRFIAYQQLVGKHWYSHNLLAWVLIFAVGLRAGAAYESLHALLRRRIILIVVLAACAAVVVLGLHFSGILWDTSSTSTSSSMRCSSQAHCCTLEPGSGECLVRSSP
jgi:membrane-bound acyltransferase YfiQ involved in biofilm formation